MIASQFKELLIEHAITGIRGSEHELEPEQLEGCLAGLERCRQWNSPEEFQRMMRKWIRRESIMHFENAPLDEYLWHCAGTMAIEFVWERMRIVWGLAGPYNQAAMRDFADLLELILGCPSREEVSGVAGSLADSLKCTGLLRKDVVKG